MRKARALVDQAPEAYGATLVAIRYGVDFKITRLLLQIGLMCAELERFGAALQITSSVKKFRADVPHPGTVLALIHVRRNDFEAAEKELNAVLGAFPEHQLAKAVLGLVYRGAGRPDWQTVLREVIEDGREEWSIRLAQSLLGEDASPYATPHGGVENEAGVRTQRLYA